MNINELVPELLCMILEYVNTNDVLNLRVVCHKFNMICGEDAMYVMCKGILKRSEDYVNVENYNKFNKTMYKSWLHTYMDIKDKLRNVNSELLLSSCSNGHVEFVRLLITQYIDPSVNDNDAIVCACMEGNYDVVKLLLSHPHVNPADMENDAIILASERGHDDIVKVLLGDNRVDPSDQNNAAVISAINQGHIKVVKLLMLDSRVNPADGNNEAIKLVWDNEYYGEDDSLKYIMIELLLSDPRVKL